MPVISRSTPGKFSTILDEVTKAVNEKLEEFRSKSFSWFIQRAQLLRKEILNKNPSIDPDTAINRELLKRHDRPNNKSIVNLIGAMIFFKYDAKHKATLPYWDMYPLVFPIEIYADGFLGINMHYLPLQARATLMDALYSLLINKDEWDENDRLRISYQILKSASKFANFKPCIKRYLYNHIRSRWWQIPIKDWEVVLFLPLARFQKETEAYVHRESLKIIKNTK